MTSQRLASGIALPLATAIGVLAGGAALLAPALVDDPQGARALALLLTGGLITFALVTLVVIDWHILRPVRLLDVRRRLRAAGQPAGSLPAGLPGEIAELAQALDHQLDADEARRQRLEGTQRAHQQQTVILQSVLSAVDDGVVVTDLSGVVLLFNAAAERLLTRAVLESELPQVLVAPLGRCLAGGAVEGQEARIPEGPATWLSITARPLLDAGSHPAGAVAVIHDVSSWKCHQEELLRARRAAEEASRLKSEFLATMSHEIRTPMNGVIGMARLLVEAPLAPEQREHAEIIHGSAEALLTVLDDILDFSKIEAGRMDIEQVELNFGDVARSVTKLLSSRAKDKRLTLSCKVQERVPAALRGDPVRLRQVITNLVGNALKFTRQGSVDVHVTAESSTAQTVVVRVEVTDTGEGIRGEALGRLFQAFSQADGSITRRHGGTGLGLAISKRLVELMGGTIGVKSELGTGSTFWFEVPLARRQPDAEPRRVLVAGGDPVSRRLAERLLARLGCAVASVDDGPHLIAGAAQHRPDVILLHWPLQGAEDCGGAQAVLKRLPAERRVRVLGVSDTPGGPGQGVDTWLPRPLDADSLRRALG